METRRFRCLAGVIVLAFVAGCGSRAPESGNANSQTNSNASTTRGAATHVDTTATMPYDLVAVDFVSVASGWIVGNDPDNNVSVILRSVNGGASWVAVLEIVGDSLLDVDFVDEEVGFAVGAEGVVYTTKDGGQTWNEEPVGTNWTSQRSVEPVIFQPKSGDTSGPPMLISESIASMYFIDAKTGWAGGDVPSGEGVNVRGMLLMTTDGGRTWTETKTPDSGPVVPAAINDLHFVSPTLGWAATGSLENGEEDALYHTTDGGMTWARQPATGGQFLRAVHFVSATRGFAVGLTIDAVTDLPGPSKLLETSDGGATWNIALVAERSFFDITFVDANRGWAVGDRAAVYATTDGGATWRQQTKFQTTGVANLQRPPKRPGVQTARAFRTLFARSRSEVWAAGEGQILRRR